MKKFIIFYFLLIISTNLYALTSIECEGRFVNPITDICWRCMFPLSIGNTGVTSGINMDTPNPSNAIQRCPAPPPIFQRIGVAIGYWEPTALVDVTRSPYCMVNLGQFNIEASRMGSGTSGQSDKPSAGAFYHVHWYKYPITYILGMMINSMCVQGGDIDIAYLSELDPLWNSSSLSAIINPEAVLFSNIIAQSACSIDAIASNVFPLTPLFWCAGSQGSIYPLTGYVSNEFSPQQSSVLLTERMAFKLNREGLVLNTVGADTAVCFEYPTPIIPKERYRYQMTNMFPDSHMCHPFGRTVMSWQLGHNTPTNKKNFGYLVWRKRNCVFL